MGHGKWQIDLDRIIGVVRAGASRDAAMLATRCLASVWLWFQLADWAGHGLR